MDCPGVFPESDQIGMCVEPFDMSWIDGLPVARVKSFTVMQIGFISSHRHSGERSASAANTESRETVSANFLNMRDSFDLQAGWNGLWENFWLFSISYFTGSWIFVKGGDAVYAIILLRKER